MGRSKEGDWDKEVERLSGCILNKIVVVKSHWEDDT